MYAYKAVRRIMTLSQTHGETMRATRPYTKESRLKGTPLHKAPRGFPVFPVLLALPYFLTLFCISPSSWPQSGHTVSALVSIAHAAKEGEVKKTAKNMRESAAKRTSTTLKSGDSEQARVTSASGSLNEALGRAKEKKAQVRSPVQGSKVVSPYDKSMTKEETYFICRRAMRSLL